MSEQPLSSSPTQEIYVDPNTDNLDDFSALMSGKAKPLEKQEPEASEPVEEDTFTQETPTEIDTEEDALEIEEELPVEKPRKKTAQDRIKELTADKYERDRLLDLERQEKQAIQAKLAELESRLPKVAPTPEPVIPEGPDPTALDPEGNMVYPLGEFDPKFIRDLTKFTIAQENKAAQAAMAKAQEEQKQKEFAVALEQNWQTKITEVEKTLPDFREKGNELVGAFSSLDPGYGQFLAQTIMGMDHGPEVLYHLAENPSLAQEIVNKGPVGATIALGRLEARFTKSEAKPRVSTAPTKTAPTVRGVAIGGEVRGDTDDLDAFTQAFFQKKRR